MSELMREPVQRRARTIKPGRLMKKSKRPGALTLAEEVQLKLLRSRNNKIIRNTKMSNTYRNGNQYRPHLATLRKEFGLEERTLREKFRRAHRVQPI